MNNGVSRIFNIFTHKNSIDSYNNNNYYFFYLCTERAKLLANSFSFCLVRDALSYMSFVVITFAITGNLSQLECRRNVKCGRELKGEREREGERQRQEKRDIERDRKKERKRKIY